MDLFITYKPVNAREVGEQVKLSFDNKQLGIIMSNPARLQPSHTYETKIKTQGLISRFFACRGKGEDLGTFGPGLMERPLV